MAVPQRGPTSGEAADPPSRVPPGQGGAADGKYPAPERHQRGESVHVPASVGAARDLRAGTLRDGD
ncbi:hypothetical protein ACFV0T_10620 [Streptomyces sp. NPDC059582]|uniref:hypothetical protein n=1 Tax=Streptomyces sp. NPDC059582 TaxID=3346875 RepID=UPI0036931C3A